MVTPLNYSNTALPLTLQVDLTASPSDDQVKVQSVAGWPPVPFLLSLERGTVREEVCLATASNGTDTFTVTRGFDGTTPQAHTALTSAVEHCAAAVTYQEPNDHINNAGTDPHPQYPLKALLDEKGAIYVFDGTSIVKLSPAVSSGQVLTSNPASTTGLEWGSGGIPTGAIWAFGGSAAPTGWVLCDGSLLSQVTYAALFAVIGTTYMTGADVTANPGLFRVPDARGRALIGAGQGTGLTNRSRGQGNSVALGTETHVLSAAELPSHTHTISHTHNVVMSTHTHAMDGDTGNRYVVTASSASHFLQTAAGANQSQGVAFADVDSTDLGTKTTGAASTANSGSVGSGTAHNNMQPSLVVNYIIKT